MKRTLIDWWTKPASSRGVVDFAAVMFFACGFVIAKLHYGDHESWQAILQRFVWIAALVLLIQAGRVILARTKPS